MDRVIESHIFGVYQIPIELGHTKSELFVACMNPSNAGLANMIEIAHFYDLCSHRYYDRQAKVKDLVVEGRLLWCSAMQHTYLPACANVLDKISSYILHQH